MSTNRPPPPPMTKDDRKKLKAARKKEAVSAMKNKKAMKGLKGKAHKKKISKARWTLEEVGLGFCRHEIIGIRQEISFRF